jgi:hypothetical protein
VVAPILPVRIFAVAEIAHGEIDHRRILPVVGNSVYDGISGAAFHAAYKGMHVPRVFGILQFGKAVVADGKVRRYHGRLIVPLVAVEDGKPVEFPKLLLLHFDMDDFRRARLLAFQCREESLNPVGSIRQNNVNKTADVENFSLHPKAVCQFSNKGPEADPLNDSPYFNFHSLSDGHMFFSIISKALFMMVMAGMILIVVMVMGMDGLYVTGFFLQPFGGFRKSLSGFPGHLEHRRFLVQRPDAFHEELLVKIQIRDQVHFVQQNHIAFSKASGYL